MATTNKKIVIAGLIVVVATLAMLSSVALSDEWTQDDGPNHIQFTPDADGNVVHGSLNYEMFETYGPVLLVLAMLMFGAIIGGAYVAKEDDEDDSN